MQGRATLGRHPVHPMLVPFPIAFFTGSFVADILHVLTGGDFWTSMGTALIAFGVVGALLAAVFGYLDYVTAPMTARAKGIATRHMLINLTVVALYVINLVLRRQSPEATVGYVLSVIGLVGLGVAGWLGGALVFEEHVGTAAPGSEARAKSEGPRSAPTGRARQ